MSEFEPPTLDGLRAFTIALHHDSDVVQVRIVGDLDLATAPELDRVLETLPGDGCHHVLLDLDDVEFMDSSGLASIVHARRFADDHGYRLTVRYNSPQIQRPFEVTNMLAYLTSE